MSEAQRQLCHHVLYDFFHGKIANPVEAGKTIYEIIIVVCNVIEGKFLLVCNFANMTVIPVN